MNRFCLLLLILFSASCRLVAQNEFITLWDTRLPGISNQNQILLPTNGNTGFLVSWELLGNPAVNGSLVANGDVLLTLPTPGMYSVKISKGSGQFFRFNFWPKSLETSDNDKILEVSQWGNTNWTVCPGFQECSNLNVTAGDAPDLSQITSTQAMFFLCKGLKGTDAFNTWQMSSIQSMHSMFTGCGKFNAPIGNWDVSSVVDMDQMFSGTSIFNQDISNWEVGNVRNFYQMFAGATLFNQNIADWDVSSGTNFTGMFQDAQYFNQPIGDWDISGTTSLWAMFYNATTFNQPIGDWDVSGVTDLTAMFSFASSFNQPLHDWDVSSVTTLWGTFLYAQNFNQPLSSWNTSNVEDMRSVFSYAVRFNQSLGSWDISNATTLHGALNNSGISCSNFDETLEGWAQNVTTPNDLSLGASELIYSTAAADRLYLTNVKGWTIEGDSYSESCGALPVILVSFSATYHEGAVNLEWRTSAESQFSHFEIERSFDGEHFEKVLKVEGGASGKRYQAADGVGTQGNGLFYYRLRLVDLDGDDSFSSMVSVDVRNSKNYVPFPNPATTFVTIGNITNGTEVQILDVGGRITYRTMAEDSVVINLESFASGIYSIRILPEDGRVINRKLVVNR